VRTVSDLLRPALGWGSPVGRPVPALARYYGAGLRFDSDPGSCCAEAVVARLSCPVYPLWTVWGSTHVFFQVLAADFFSEWQA
jgi:hypothetical protein